MTWPEALVTVVSIGAVTILASGWGRKAPLTDDQAVMERQMEVLRAGNRALQRDLDRALRRY